MRGEDYCEICGEDVGLTSHYHCPVCSKKCGMMGHPECQEENLEMLNDTLSELDMDNDTSRIVRTGKGDQLLVLCQTNPNHPDVRAWVAEIRDQSAHWDKYTDQEIVDMSIFVFANVAKSRSGSS